ncbi:queuosine precursor transporter [Aquirufa regiilacus]|uniref:Probable queuosine precursor transporter n=1 Tax=Aquirufa regiilacus TaxID=3024868 RepID=A0ABU3TQV7_9BACT|nr:MULTISPECIES: queuosine precursor transporter [unclassified Aquirufa]MDT8886835.1 queuosine precursor transporter [Aquirufa sp. LEPPI-3A]MDU0808200.1 queuosine precursor transporter [Aquirufa sp. LEOWEIH-7C]
MIFQQFSRKQKLFIFLFGIFLTNAIIAEIIGVKIVSIEKSLGFSPLHLPTTWGTFWDLNQTAGALNWPIVFIVSDIINDYFGKKGVRFISFTTAGFIAYSFIIIYVATLLVPADFWLDTNRGDSNFNINEAFSRIFRQGLGIITGSLIAFLVSQIVDALIFERIKAKTGGKMIWLRATGSTLISQLIDSFLVIGVAFYLFGNWSLAQWFNVSLNNYLYKFFVAILFTPVLYVAHYYIEAYLKKED